MEQRNQRVKAEFARIEIPTYSPGQAMDLPMFFEKKPYQGASGRLYPLPFTDSLKEKKEPVVYEAALIENEYIRVTVLPGIGGKIHRAFDKINSYDFIYHNSVIKPAMIGLAGPWVSGGIEFNWPQHHRPTTFMPVEAAIEDDGEGKTVWVGEIDPFHRMKGMAGISIYPGRSFLRAKVRVYNGTQSAHPFMWWSNLAVPVNDNYRIIFPPDVEWVNDHDRRAVIGWPIAKGVYRTARPFDYGPGTDLSRYDSVKVPSSFMISQGQSDMDFVAGYDEEKQAGVVAFADHLIAPGKKLFHWGKGEFGDMWCSNLTDESGPYVELMTGVYTDNQPDFSWIMPQETKIFDQYWYPVREIGGVKNATLDAAVNLEKRGEALFLGVQATGTFPRCTIELASPGKILWNKKIDLDPEKPFTVLIPFAEIGERNQDVCVTLRSEDGRILVSYTSPERGKRKPIEPRKPVVRPAEIGTTEELYVNGLHLEQYKQHCYEPGDYYREGLRRDPRDIRCNTGMARLSLERGLFEACIEHCDAAIERMTARNEHPMETEAFYLKGIALVYLARYTEAISMLGRAIWGFSYRASAHYELAAIASREGRYDEAIQHIDECLQTGQGNLKALNLKAAILRNMGYHREAKNLAQKTSETDRLDLWSRVELSYAASQLGKEDEAERIRSDYERIFGSKNENYLDVVCSYMKAGFLTDALAVLEKMDKAYPLTGYYIGRCRSLLGEDPSSAYREAEAACKTCFPSRLEDIDVLSHACMSIESPVRATYLLGCLYYDRFRYGDASSCWERTIALDSSHSYAYRNLSLISFDKRKDYRSARLCMERAFDLKSGNARLLYEYQQLLKHSGAGPEERIAVYQRHEELTLTRDDCYLDLVTLHAIRGDYARSVELVGKRTFHIYEGGEGKLTRLHAWLFVLQGNALREAGKSDDAEKSYRRGMVIPKSYGEAKSYFAQESHLHYFLGSLLESQGRREEAAHAYEKAGEDKSVVSDISLFRALALQRMGSFARASEVLHEMMGTAEKILSNPDLYPYFGVGSPTPMPFEYDIEKINTVEGNILKAYALLGLGRGREALRALDEARAWEPYDFRIHAFEEIKNRI